MKIKPFQAAVTSFRAFALFASNRFASLGVIHLEGFRPSFLYLLVLESRLSRRDSMLVENGVYFHRRPSRQGRNV
jgi:hypothetical protein